MKELTIYNLSLPKLIAAANEDGPITITFRVMDDNIDRHTALGMHDFIAGLPKTDDLIVKFDLLGSITQHGLIVMLGVQKENRRIAEHASVSISKEVILQQGTADEVVLGAESSMKIDERIARIISENSDISREEFIAWCNEDKWLSADELVMFDVVEGY